MNVDDLFRFGKEYISKGWPIIPCTDKTPCNGNGRPCSDWHTLEVTEDRLLRGLRGADKPMIGMLIGPNSAIDIETDNEKEVKAVEYLFRECPVPVTPTYKSNRGMHRLYLWDDRLNRITKGILEFRAPGDASVKIRLGAAGKGTQSIIPPSQGRAWLPNLSLSECSLAPLPEAVIQRLLDAANGRETSADARTSGCCDGASTSAEALSEMLKVESSAQESDGSMRLIRVCHVAIKHALDLNSAVATIRSYERVRPFPKRWSDEDISTRLSDAAERIRVKLNVKGDRSFGLISLADVKSEEVEWLWPDRIPYGKLTLIVGDPDVGKSLSSLDIVSRVSRGDAMPFSENVRTSPGGVILLSAEDGLGDTIRPRLEALGANCKNVNKLADEMFNLKRDTCRLADAIRKVDNCKLVVIDPISAYMGNTDSHNNFEVRSVLMPLAEIAQETGVAILAITHMRKGEGAALYRAIGSLAYIAAARAAWLICRDRNDPEQRLILPLKNNLASGRVGGVAFRIESHPSTSQPVIKWVKDNVQITVDVALAHEQGKRGPKTELKELAVNFINDALRDGPRLAAELYEEAESQGVKERTLRRAKQEMGVADERHGYAGQVSWSMSP